MPDHLAWMGGNRNPIFLGKLRSRSSFSPVLPQELWPLALESHLSWQMYAVGFPRSASGLEMKHTHTNSCNHGAQKSGGGRWLPQ